MQPRKPHTVVPLDEYISYDQTVDLVSDLLSGRIIAFHREFVDIAGSASGALFLSQAMYWMKKSKKDGWFYKNREEWTEETGLTRYEQEAARKILKAQGILEEIRQGCPFQLYFRINKRKLYGIITALHSVENNPMDGGIQPNERLETTQCSAENNRPYKEAEITTETTHKLQQETPYFFELTPVDPKDPKGSTQKEKQAKEKFPDWLPMEQWLGYVDMRKKSRNPLTEYAQKLELKELARLRGEGHDPVTVLEQSIKKTYRGLFAPNAANGNHVPPPEDALERERRKDAERISMRQSQVQR